MFFVFFFAYAQLGFLVFGTQASETPSATDSNPFLDPGLFHLLQLGVRIVANNSRRFRFPGPSNSESHPRTGLLYHLRFLRLLRSPR